MSNLGCRTQFALEGCSKTDLFENRNIRNSENEINLFCTPKEDSETSVSEELGVRVIRLSNKLRARITWTKEKPRFGCTRTKGAFDSSCRRKFLPARGCWLFFFGDHHVHAWNKVKPRSSRIIDKTYFVRWQCFPPRTWHENLLQFVLHFLILQYAKTDKK